MQSRIVVSKVRSKILLIHLRACRYMRMINSLQNAGKVLSITLNIQESFYNQGKLGKAFFHLSTRKGFRSSRKGFVNLFPNLGKLLKILGKVSFQIFPKLPWERKGKGKLSVLPMHSQCAQSQATLEVYSYTSKVPRTFLKKPQILICLAQ